MRWQGVIAVDDDPTIDGRIVRSSVLEKFDGRVVMYIGDPGLDLRTALGTVDRIEHHGNLWRAFGECRVEVPVGAACAMSLVSVESGIEEDDEGRMVFTSGRLAAVWVRPDQEPVWPQAVIEPNPD